MNRRAVRWSETAEKDLRRLDPQKQRRVAQVIIRFAETNEGEIKRLQGPLGAEFRLRAGDLRIRFRMDHDGTMLILRVLPRDKAYR
jgi:mRNA-degrading endonuclease RelE of RelBE toxin-antitoxin system